MLRDSWKKDKSKSKNSDILPETTASQSYLYPHAKMTFVCNPEVTELVA